MKRNVKRLEGVPLTEAEFEDRLKRLAKETTTAFWGFHFQDRFAVLNDKGFMLAFAYTKEEMKQLAGLFPNSYFVRVRIGFKGTDVKNTVEEL